MSLLVVDDRDGRIVAEATNPDEAQRIIEMLWADECVPDYLCLVEVRSHRGRFMDTDTSIAVRPLLEPAGRP